MYTYRRRLLFHLLKGNPVTCCNTDTTLKHIRRNKPVTRTQKQVLDDLIYMWNLKNVKFIRTEKAE